jgi:hypothetical protein
MTATDARLLVDFRVARDLLLPCVEKGGYRVEFKLIEKGRVDDLDRTVRPGQINMYAERAFRAKLRRSGSR